MAHLKIITRHQSTPTQDVQGATQPQENSMLEDLKDLKIEVSKHTGRSRGQPKTSTTNSTRGLIHQDQHFASSCRMHNLQNLKRVLKEIGQGKSPTSTIVDGTTPQYWTIRTDNEGYADELRQDIEDRVSLKDQRSRDEHKLWRKRGGQGAGLRVRANYLSQFFIDHVAIRLVDGASGNSCVGINFVAQHDDNKKENKRKNKDNDEEKGRGRFFMLVEDELSRNPEKLRLRMRKVAGSFGLRFSLEHLKTLLREAPVLIVMPDVGIDLVFWDQHALRDIVKEKCSNRW